MKIKIKTLTENARLPTYATDGSGCFDIYVDHTNWPEQTQREGFHIFPGAPYHLATGLSFEIPKGYVMLVFSRSGHGFNDGVRLSNCVGVIDSDYRGELKVSLHNDLLTGRKVIDVDDRIAQAMVVPVAFVEFVVSDELSKTARGSGGMGSTGA